MKTTLLIALILQLTWVAIATPKWVRLRFCVTAMALVWGVTFLAYSYCNIFEYASSQINS